MSQEHLYLNQFLQTSERSNENLVESPFPQRPGTETNNEQPASILCMFHLAISAAVVPTAKRAGDAHQCSFVSCKIMDTSKLMFAREICFKQT